MDRHHAPPGYRRRIEVIPARFSVTARLEDDYHCMAVTLDHDGVTVAAVHPEMQRGPWSTCPGALAKLVETFAGLRLAQVTARRDKQANCTHLHDLAVLAAMHAGDEAPLVFDILGSDPAAGHRTLELYRNGLPLVRWEEQDGVLTAPGDIAGRTLFTLRDWIASLPPVEREAARLLQWASIVAHGRGLPARQLHRAGDMPANCYTFQPERVASAARIGEIVDFSRGTRAPLEGIAGRQPNTGDPDASGGS